MAYTHSNAAALAAVNAIVDLVDVGSGTAQVIIYDATGGVPSLVDDAISTQVTLAEVDLPDPAFGAAADQSPGATAALLGVPLSDNSINATGTAAFFRVLNKDGTAVFQGTTGTEMIVDTVSFQSAATFTISALTLSLVEG